MSRPITWQNVSSPDFGGISAGMSDAFARIRQGLNGTRNRGIEDRLENRLTTSHAMKMLQGEETLNQQQFDNAHAGEKLAASLASSRAYSRTTNTNQDIADKLRSDTAAMQTITDKVERNADGSANRPAIRKIASEAGIPSTTIDLGIDIADRVSGQDDVIAARAGELKQQRAMAIKRAGSSGSSGGDVFTGFDDSVWGSGEGQTEANDYNANLKLDKFSKTEREVIMSAGTKPRGLLTIGEKEFSSSNADVAKLKVLARRDAQTGK